MPRGNERRGLVLGGPLDGRTHSEWGTNATEQGGTTYRWAEFTVIDPRASKQLRHFGFWVPAGEVEPRVYALTRLIENYQPVPDKLWRAPLAASPHAVAYTCGTCDESIAVTVRPKEFPAVLTCGKCGQTMLIDDPKIRALPTTEQST